MASLVATKDHCFLCFDALSSHLSHDGKHPHFETSSHLVPLFVTWKKQGKLRGCIGNLSPQPFPQGLVEYAIRAGVEDHRFNRMELSELSKCTVGVSLLVNFEPDLRWDDWEIGTHGMVLRFTVGSEEHRAVFLPEVAREQGWTKRETIEALAKKSGFNGRVDDRVLEKMRIERFVSSKAEATYGEWLLTRSN